jgi:threonine/homoserine/homoserine lactone efflux protein
MGWVTIAADAASTAGGFTAFLSSATSTTPATPQWRAIGLGVLLGLGAATPLGPVNVEIARRVLRHGFRAGVALGMGAVTVDVLYALVSTFSFVRLDERSPVLTVVAVVGAGLLAYLGVQSLRAARAAWRHDPLADAAAADNVADRAGDVPADEPAGPANLGSGTRSAGRPAYLTGLLMTLANPMTLAFWFTGFPATGGLSGPSTGSPTAANGVATVAGTLPVVAAGPHVAAADLPMMCAGVFIGTTAWVFAFASLLALAAARAGAGRPDRRRKWLVAADVVGGVTLLGFAVAAILRLVRGTP